MGSTPPDDPLTDRSDARPSLFSGDRATTGAPRQGEASSILSSLNDDGRGKPARAHAKGSTAYIVGALAFLAVVAGAGVLLSSEGDRTNAAPGPISSTSPASPAVRGGSSDMDDASPPSAGGAPSLAAIIENAPVRPLAAAKAVPAPSGEKLATAPSVAAPGSADAPDPRPSSSRGTVRELAPKDQRTKEKLLSGARKTGEPAARRNVDGDAALLAALFAHGEARAATAPAGKSILVEGKASPAKTASPRASDQAAAGKFDPKRDVVLKDETLPMGELVRRCNTLGFLEGALCRYRVCSDSWGKDPACPGTPSADQAKSLIDERQRPK